MEGSEEKIAHTRTHAHTDFPWVYAYASAVPAHALSPFEIKESNKSITCVMRETLGGCVCACVCAIFLSEEIMTHKMRDVLKTLNDFQILSGFENFNDENAVYIYETEMPFIIKKTEWKRALLWGMEMPLRAINEMWTAFEELGYLQPTGDKEPQAWLQVALIRKDIELHYPSVEAYLEASK